MQLNRARFLQIALGFAVSVGLCVAVFHDIEWEALGSALLAANWWAFFPASAVFVLHMALRAYRWRLLFPTEERPRFSVLFHALSIGNLASFLLPLRAGEVVRPFALSRKSTLSFPRAFASIIIERFFDLGCVLLTFGLLLTVLPGLPDWSYRGAQGLAFMAAMLLVFLLLGILCPTWTEKIIERCSSWLPKRIQSPVQRISRDFFLGSRELRDIGKLSQVLLLTVAVWSTCHLFFYCYLWLFPIEATVLLAVSVSVIVALAVAAPSAPGFLGVYQVGCIAAFALFDVPYETGVAFSLLSHLHQYLWILILGFFGLFSFGFGVRDLSRAAPPAPAGPGLAQ